jgi:L-threonylcarbamoyladenylate synthase
MAVAEMNGRAGAIIDGGTCRRGLESTVAMITEDSVTILRPGSITAEMLGEVIGSPVDTLLTSEDTGPRSPGTRHAHYQPRAPVFVTNVVDLPRIASAFSERPVGVLCLNCGTSSAPHGLIIRSLDDLDDYAHRLYREFTLLDEMGCCAIVAELPASGGLGDALRDRLLRASGGRTVPHGT